jgi:hypothetical protein
MKDNEVGGECDSASEGRQNCKRFKWESPKERDHSEHQGVDGRMGSEWILGRFAGGCRVDSDGYCEHGNETSDSGVTE